MIIKISWLYSTCLYHVYINTCIYIYTRTHDFVTGFTEMIYYYVIFWHMKNDEYYVIVAISMSISKRSILKSSSMKRFVYTSERELFIRVARFSFSMFLQRFFFYYDQSFIIDWFVVRVWKIFDILTER